jgi:hypothetical protein
LATSAPTARPSGDYIAAVIAASSSNSASKTQKIGEAPPTLFTSKL